MENVYSVTEFKSILSRQQQRLRRNRHRMPLWMIEPNAEVELAQSQCVARLEQWLGEKALGEGLWISSKPIANHAYLTTANYRQMLGQEWPLIVIDARDGLRANLLAAAAGSLAAGGLLIIITTPLSDWLSQPCSETLRLFGEPLTTAGFFLPRLVKLYRQKFYWMESEQVLEPQQAQYLTDNKPKNTDIAPDFSHQTAQEWRAMSQQQQAIECIKQVFKGHAKRPCVLTADRGRGKSSALGVAVAELVNATNKSFVITAPNSQACQQVFHWFNKLVPEELQHHLQFVAPDELIHRLHERALKVDGVLVDEAAAIPVPMLRQLLLGVNRLVFSSTIHGYEGNGRGFAIRFTSELDSLMPQWRSFQLHDPIRWSAGDPLESWVRDALLLAPSLIKSQMNAPGDPHSANLDEFSLDKVEWSWISPGQAVEEPILAQAFTLLVESHYQTTPDDLRQLMDHPHRNLLVGVYQSQVVAVSVLLKESGLDKDLAQQVMNGKRRVRGQLTPQSFAYNLRMSELAQLCGWRVQRIAVLAEYRRQFLGRCMLQQIERRAKQQNLDYLSSSFAASSDLLPFWLSADFQPVRLGLKRDKSSGCHSLLVCKPLQLHPRWPSLQPRFFEITERLLSSTFQQLDAEIIVQLWQQQPLRSEISSVDLNNAKAFFQGECLLEDVIDTLDRLLRAGLSVKPLDEELSSGLQALVAAIWQWREPGQLAILLGVSGKQQVQDTLQLHVQRIVDRITSSSTKS